VSSSGNPFLEGQSRFPNSTTAYFIPRKVLMETTLTINIPAPSARARGAGVGGGGGGGEKEEKIKVCFKLCFLHNLLAPTSPIDSF
jgi:hypothetical protein